MRKVTSSKKVNVKKFLYILSLAIGIGLASPVIASATSADTSIVADNATEGEDLFVDETDDAKTEDIKETDVVENNVVVDETKKEEETTASTENQSTQTTEETTEKVNDGGSCVTPENNYTEGEGEYWNPSIKTEEEKKGINQDTPTPEPDTPTPEPDTPTPEPDTPTPEPDTPTPEPDTPTPEPDTPTPEPDEPTPRTGVEMDWLALLSAAGLTLGGGVGLIKAATNKEEGKIKKR